MAGNLPDSCPPSCSDCVQGMELDQHAEMIAFCRIDTDGKKFLNVDNALEKVMSLPKPPNEVLVLGSGSDDGYAVDLKLFWGIIPNAVESRLETIKTITRLLENSGLLVQFVQ